MLHGVTTTRTFKQCCVIVYRNTKGSLKRIEGKIFNKRSSKNLFHVAENLYKYVTCILEHFYLCTSFVLSSCSKYSGVSTFCHTTRHYYLSFTLSWSNRLEQKTKKKETNKNLHFLYKNIQFYTRFSPASM